MAFEKAAVKQYVLSFEVVHTVKTHTHAGDVAVEHGDQAGDTTLHTRVFTAALISSTSKRRLKPIDPNYTAFPRFTWPASTGYQSSLSRTPEGLSSLVIHNILCCGSIDTMMANDGSSDGENNFAAVSNLRRDRRDHW